MSRNQILGFIIGLLSASWLGQFLILKQFGAPDAPGAGPFLLIVMFFPGLFGLGFTIFSKNIRRAIQWRPAGPFAILTAVIIPLIIAFCVIAILNYGCLGASDYFQFTRNSVNIASGPWMLGTGAQTWPVFLANILVTSLLYASFAGLATIGEEFGWRGVLQNAMIREFGFGKGVALLGFVWGFWHFPIILAGYNYPETPVLGALILMPLLLISASFIMAWLTLWNRSFWPAVFMHGTINSVYNSMITKITLVQQSLYTTKLIEIGVFIFAAILAYMVARPLAQRLKG